MALIEIKPGDEADANIVMDNFNYLDERISEVNEKVNNIYSSVDVKISTLNTTIENNVNQLTEDLSKKINSEIERENGALTSIVLKSDRIHQINITTNSTVILPTLEDNTKYINTMLEFTLKSSCSLTIPNNLSFCNGIAPTFIADGKTIQRLIFDTTNGGTVWNCYYNWVGK